jgi:hypothetical protein
MPTEVRVPGAIIEASRRDLSANQRFAKGKSSPQKWREARDVEIRERFANGETAGLIAEALGLSRSRVNEILYRERVA